MNRLQGRGLNFFQMYLEGNSYQFKARPVKNISEDEKPYLFQIPTTNGTTNGTIRYDIIKKEYLQYARKGTVDIQLKGVAT